MKPLVPPRLAHRDPPVPNATGLQLQLLIVDEKHPQRVLRVTVTAGEGDGLLRGGLDVEELRADELFELLHNAPDQRTVIVHSSALKLQKTTPTWA